MSLETAKEKLAKRFEGNIDPRLKEIYVAPYGGVRPEESQEKRFFLLNRAMEILTQSDTRSLLILGDSGAGKTSLCLHLGKRLWALYQEDEGAPASSSSPASSAAVSSPFAQKPLPIYIHLAQYKKYLAEGLLEQTLKDIGLTSEETRNLKTTQPLLLLLDGFDEVDIQENLYQTQRWDQPSYQIRMVITCRPEALAHKNKQALFETPQGNWKGSHYETVYIQSFTEEQIRVYLERYLYQNSKDTSSSLEAPASATTCSSEFIFSEPFPCTPLPPFSLLRVEDYLEWFERLPSLKELIKTPFLLTVAVRALPGIIASLKTSPSGEASALGNSPTSENISISETSSISENSSFTHQKNLTQSRLFKAFLTDWFLRQAKRVKAQGLLAMFSEKEIQGYMEAYAKNLAASLIDPEGQLNERTLREEECLRPELIEPYQDEALLERYRDSNPLQNQSQHFFDEPSPGIKTQTETQKAHLRAILSGCMLRSAGNQFRFIHKSVAEYLAAQELMEGLLGNYDRYLEDYHLRTLWEETKKDKGLNRTLLTKEPQILARLAEMSQENERFKELLEAIIVATKTRRGLHVAAANAITILNQAGTNFCNRDFSQIQIPGANLTGCQCAGTHFEGANLKEVTFQRAYLLHAHFEGANLEGVVFGEQAYWEMPATVNALLHHTPRPGVSEWLVGCSDGYAYRLNDRGKQLTRYRHKPYERVDKNEVQVTALALHRPSSRFATGGSNHLIWVWALKGSALYRLEGHTHSITALAFHPNGRLASGSYDNTIRCWQNDGASGQVLQGHKGVVRCLLFHPDGRLVSGSDDKRIRWWQVDGTREGSMLRAGTPIMSLAFHPGGPLVSGGYDGTIHCWQIDGTSGPVLQGGEFPVTSLAFHPDGRLVSGSWDKTIRCWEVDGRSGPVLRGHKEIVTSLAFHPDGRLASGSWDRTIRWWKIDDDTPNSVPPWGHGGFTSFAFHPDGRFAFGNNDGTIRWWKTDGTAGPVLRGHCAGAVSSLAFHPDGRLVSAGWDRTIRWWHADGTSGAVLRGDLGWVICKLTFHSDGRFASANWDKKLRCWHADGTSDPLLSGHALEGMGLAFHSDGRLASAGKDNTICLWQPDGTPGPVLQGHEGEVTSLAFHPNGHLASGSKDSTIRCWQADGTAGPALRGHEGELASLVFHPDGRLLSGGDDQTLRLWSFIEVRLLRTLEVGFCCNNLVVEKKASPTFYADANGGTILAFFIDAAHQFHVQWIRTGQPHLVLTGAHLQGALNVSEENQTLLRQRGAEGTPQQAAHPYLPWCHLFQPITGTAHVEPQPPLVNMAGTGRSPHLISNTTWVVSIARKKEEGISFASFFGTSGSDHGFLILEGIQDRRRFIIRAELIYDKKTEQVHITMTPLDDLLRFKAFVARGIEAHQFPIDASVGQALLRHIQADQQKLIHYSLLGDRGKIYSSLLPSAATPAPSSNASPLPSASAPSNPASSISVPTPVTETHNCLSWCRKQVMQIGEEMPTRWYNFAVTLPSDITAPEGSTLSSSTSFMASRPKGGKS